MKPFTAILYALLGVFSIFIMLTAIFGSVGEFIHDGPCGTPQASLLTGIVILFPATLWITYRGLRFSKESNIFPRLFLWIFRTGRAVCIVAVLVEVFIWSRLSHIL